MKKKLPAALLVAAIILGTWFFFRSARPKQRQALLERKAATYILGQYLAGKFAHKNVLIASNPFTQMSGRPREVYQFEAAGLDGLREGFGGKINYKIVFPELRSGARETPESLYVDPQTSTPLSFLVAEDAFDRLFAANPEYKICASLIGLPSNLAQTESWKNDHFKFALLLPDWRLIGNPEVIRAAFKSEKIVAAVVNRPDLHPKSEANGQDYHKLFDEHFLLVTADNCDALMSRYRRLF